MKKTTLLVLALLLTVPIVMAFANKGANIRRNNIEQWIDKLPESKSLLEQKMGFTDKSYLMYTHDGEWIMWGDYDHIYFSGTDNHGADMWGFYGNRYIIGFYDNELFVGRHGRIRWELQFYESGEYFNGMYKTFS